MNTQRGTVLRRLARLYAMTQTRRYRPSFADVARELGVSTRTARRYLQALEDAGLALPLGWVGDGRRVA